MNHPYLDVANKTVVIIGGTSGIGLTLAEGFARARANVIPTGRRHELVLQACKRVVELGGRTLALPSDVADRASLEALLAAACATFGSVDVLINCAGRTKRGPTLDVAEEEWNAILDTNLTGTLRSCQIFGRHMIERRYGRIINLGSLTSFVGMFEVAAYAASKSAVGSLTKSLAIEWAQRGVCVNAIAPGVFRTDLNAELIDGTARGKELLQRTPMGRFGKLEELVGAAIFLASDAASYVTGQTVTVDGGFLASGVNQ